MPRYITEQRFTTKESRITLPTCARIIGISKVSNYFLLMAEIWGNPALVYDLDIKIFHKEEYMHPEHKYIGYTIVGTDVYHFSYTEVARPVEDTGGDGGFPGESDPDYKPIARETIPILQAGGLTEL